MAEPVSAIAGLVVTGAKIGVTLNDLVQTLRDAPAAIRHVGSELYAVNAALCQIQAWFGDEKTRPKKNIQKDIRAIVAACQDTFNELEMSIEGLKPGAWSRVLWTTKEKHVLELSRRMESHKAALNLIITVVSGQTGARVEDRLDRMGYLLGHMVKNQKKMSKRVRAMESSDGSNQKSSPEAKPPSINPFLDANSNEEPVQQLADPPASRSITEESTSPTGASSPTKDNRPNVTLPTQRTYSGGHIHPAAAQSQLQDTRRMSISSQYTATDSEISGITDRTLSDLDVDAILRPASIYSLASTDTSSGYGSANSSSSSSSTKRRRMATLHEILNRKTQEPWSLFNFYVYMRDEMRSVDYLDCWLDMAQHTTLCCSFINQRVGQENLSMGSDVVPPIDSPFDWSAAHVSDFLQKEIEDRPVLPNVVEAHVITREELLVSAEKLLYTYILPGSEREVVLPKSMTHDMVDRIEMHKRDDPDVFKEAFLYIFEAMQRDSYPKFMRRRRAMRQDLIRSPFKTFQNLSQRFKYEPISEEDPSTPDAHIVFNYGYTPAPAMRYDSSIQRLPPEQLFSTLSGDRPVQRI